MRNEGKQTLYELIAGVILISCLLLVGNVFAGSPLAYTLGVLLGGFLAVLMSFHMYSSIAKAMLYDQKNAEKKMKSSSFLRMVGMFAAVAAAAMLPELFSVIGVLLGLLSLKFSAYLQPLTHKIYAKIIGKGR